MLFNANGWMLAGVNTNSETVTLWDTATRKVVANVEDSAAVSVTTAAFSQGGAFLAVGEGTGRLMIWQVGSQSVYKVLIDAVAGQKTMTKEINSVAFSPDGKLLAASLAAGLVQLWDATTYQEVGTLAGTEAGVGAIAFSPDGKLLAGATNTNEVLLWSMPGRQRVGALTYQDTDRDRVAAQVFSIAFSPDGSTLVAGTGGGLIVIWDIASRRVVKTLGRFTSYGNTDSISGVMFSPSGDILAAVLTGGIKLWAYTPQATG